MFDFFGCPPSLRIKNPCVARFQDLRRALPDVAETNQTDSAIRQAPERSCRHVTLFHWHLPAFAHGTVIVCYVPQDAEHEQQRLLCDSFRVHACGIAHADATRCCRFHINLVEGHTLRMNHLERGKCTDQVSRDSGNGVHHEDIRIRHAAGILLRGQAHRHADDAQRLQKRRFRRIMMEIFFFSDMEQFQMSQFFLIPRF